VIDALAITVNRLLWDKQNRDHIRKHNLVPRQVESVFHDPQRIAEAVTKGRLKVIGRCGKRILTLILVPEGKKFYVVTARDADAAERALYRAYFTNHYEKTV
jgi:uncharacterized DUF497 family protein